MMKRKPTSIGQRVAVLGLLSALTVVLSALESALPALPVPGARLGLANLALTAAVWWFGVPSGAAVAAIKVLFVMLMRGATAAWMACFGTAAAVLMTALLLPLCRRERVTFVGVSVASAAAHTLGQLATATVLMGSAVTAYAPWMLLISVPSGVVTGLVLNATVPRLTMVVNNVS